MSSMPISPPSSRVLLMPDATSAATGTHASKVRRYRLARMRLLERRDAAPARAPQLGRSYD
jgi:hypothetical protein